MITTSSINKTFRRLHVLTDVTITFPSSCVTAVIGPNGSGKTTLMKSIVGLVRPETGAITVNGVAAIDNPACRSAIGYMSQVAHYPENLAPADLISMVRGVRGGGWDIADELVDEFQLTPHIRKPMRTLSGGTRQKVGAILAFMYNPACLLLDEPTAGLDPVVTERLKERIRGLRDAGCTILITSHVLSEIQELADRIIYLHEGRVAYDGTVDELLSRTGHTALNRSIASIMSGEAGGGQ
jgi:Cu-processing system ATP-binding protein